MNNRFISRLILPIRTPAPARWSTKVWRPLDGSGVKIGLRWALAAAIGLVTPAGLAGEPPAAATGKKAPAAATPRAAVDAKGTPAKADPAAKEGPKKEASAEDRALHGVVVIERAGQPLALGAVLGGDGRILSALSPIASGNDLDARFADGSVVRVKLGHHDRMWDLALLVPQSGKWGEGLVASTKEPVRADGAIRQFTLVKGKVASQPITLRSHRTLLGGDDKPLENAIEIGSRVSPLDLGTPLLDEDGHVVGLLGRGCAPNENRACTPVAFGAPIQAIKNFLRTVPAAAVAPAAWLGIQGVSETSGIAHGVRIVMVHPESPADEAHLKGGDKAASDVILAVDGVPVTTPEALAEAIRAHGVGEKVPLTVFSQGKYRQVSVLLRTAPEAKPAPPAPANPAELPGTNETAPAAPAKKP